MASAKLPQSGGSDYRTFRHPANGELSIRTQFLGAGASRSPLVYKVKIVAERSTGDGHWVSADREFKGDAEPLDELQSRVSNAPDAHASTDSH